MKTTEEAIGWWPTLIILLSCAFTLTPTLSNNPHAPQKLTWEMLNEVGGVVWSATRVHPPWTWWPVLQPDICKLAAGSPAWDFPTHEKLDKPPPEKQCVPNGIGSTLGCLGQFFWANLQAADFYVCPSQGRSREQGRSCGGAESYFCAQWGCETTGEAYWKPSSSWDLIIIKRGHEPSALGQGERDSPISLDPVLEKMGLSCPTPPPHTHHGPCKDSYCNPLKISFTAPGKLDRQWLRGNHWGWRIYAGTGTGDLGFVFTIRLKIESLPARTIAPNSVLANPHPRSVFIPTQRFPSFTSSSGEFSPHSPDPPLFTAPSLPGTENRLFSLMQGAFLAPNCTNPNATQSC